MKISYIYGHNHIFFLILANILLQVFSFVLVKAAAINASNNINLFFNMLYLYALSLEVIRSLVWQLILKKKDISVVYPLNSLVPVLILLSGFVFFNEYISSNNIIGVFILMFGIFFIMDGK